GGNPGFQLVLPRGCPNATRVAFSNATAPPHVVLVLPRVHPSGPAAGAPTARASLSVIIEGPPQSAGPAVPNRDARLIGQLLHSAAVPSAALAARQGGHASATDGLTDVRVRVPLRRQQRNEVERLLLRAL